MEESSLASIGPKGEYGWDGFASTPYWANPEKDLIVIVLSQHYPFSPQLKAIKPLIYDAIVDRKTLPVELNNSGVPFSLA